MENSFNINHCVEIGCEKVIENCACLAYQDPTKLSWFRHGEECPAGPYQSDDTKLLRKQKLNPLKASKRARR